MKKLIPITILLTALSVNAATADDAKLRLCEIALERLVFENHFAQAAIRNNLRLMSVSFETGIPRELLIDEELEEFTKDFGDDVPALQQELRSLCK